jgi:hypothetical protein
MARQTNYVVQTYVAGRGAGLKSEPTVSCKTPEAAKQMAERLSETKLGVVAFSTSGDPDTGDYDEEPTMLFRAGRLPPQFEG